MKSDKGIKCPKCGLVSHHPEDIKQKFCGNCGMFHAHMKGKRKTDKQIFGYSEERKKGIQALSEKLRDDSKALTQDQQTTLDVCLKILKLVTPGPAVCKLLGQFLVDMAEEQYKQDKIYGTDSDDPNQLTIAVVRKKQ